MFEGAFAAARVGVCCCTSRSCPRPSEIPCAQAVKDASTTVFADASGTVFGSWCPPAAAKVANLTLLNDETISRAVQHASERCTNTSGSGQTADVIVQALTGSEPLLERVADALGEARTCGCQPSPACMWCSPAQVVNRPIGPQLPAGRLPPAVEPATKPPTKPAASGAASAPSMTALQSTTTAPLPRPIGPQLPAELQHAREQQRASAAPQGLTPAPVAPVSQHKLVSQGPVASRVPFGPQLPPGQARG